jgi:hypothetical protein
MNPPIPTLSPVSTRIRVERLMHWVAGVAVGLGLGVGTMVALGVGVGMIVAVGLGLGGMVGLTLGVAVGLGVVVGLTVAVGVGVGVVTPQLPLTLNTRCMFGNPIAAVVVGVVIPQAVALR